MSLPDLAVLVRDLVRDNPIQRASLSVMDDTTSPCHVSGAARALGDAIDDVTFIGGGPEALVAVLETIPDKITSARCGLQWDSSHQDVLDERLLAVAPRLTRLAELHVPGELLRTAARAGLFRLLPALVWVDFGPEETHSALLAFARDSPVPPTRVHVFDCDTRESVEANRAACAIFAARGSLTHVCFQAGADSEGSIPALVALVRASPLLVQFRCIKPLYGADAPSHSPSSAELVEALASCHALRVVVLEASPLVACDVARQLRQVSDLEIVSDALCRGECLEAFARLLRGHDTLRLLHMSTTGNVHYNNTPHHPCDPGVFTRIVEGCPRLSRMDVSGDGINVHAGHGVPTLDDVRSDVARVAESHEAIEFVRVGYASVLLDLSPEEIEERRSRHAAALYIARNWRTAFRDCNMIRDVAGEIARMLWPPMAREVHRGEHEPGREKRRRRQ